MKLNIHMAISAILSEGHRWTPKITLDEATVAGKIFKELHNSNVDLRECFLRSFETIPNWKARSGQDKWEELHTS